MKKFSSGLCLRVIWCIIIKCTGKPNVPFYKLWDETRIFVISVLPNTLHGIISQKNFAFLFAAKVAPWVSQKLCSEVSYCHRFISTSEKIYPHCICTILCSADAVFALVYVRHCMRPDTSSTRKHWGLRRPRQPQSFMLRAWRKQVLIAWFKASVEKYTRTAHFWDITRWVLVIPYRRFGKKYRPLLQGSRVRPIGCSQNIGKELTLLAE